RGSFLRARRPKPKLMRLTMMTPRKTSRETRRWVPGREVVTLFPSRAAEALAARVVMIFTIAGGAQAAIIFSPARQPGRGGDRYWCPHRRGKLHGRAEFWRSKQKVLDSDSDPDRERG